MAHIILDNKFHLFEIVLWQEYMSYMYASLLISSTCLAQSIEEVTVIWF
jgi:hypothetical protein